MLMKWRNSLESAFPIRLISLFSFRESGGDCGGGGGGGGALAPETIKSMMNEPFGSLVRM